MKQQRIIFGHGAILPLFMDGVCLHILDISLSINCIIWREISVSNQLEYASRRTWFYATFLPYFPFPTQFATFKFQDIKLSYVKRKQQHSQNPQNLTQKSWNISGRNDQA
jgi:hypothetical protein